MMKTTGIALVALAGLMGACGASGEAGDGEPDEGDKFSAAVMCEEFVKDRLKAPATAEFDTEPGTKSGKAWVVQGVVDSENGFGAMLRSDFTCRLRYAGDDEWQLVKLSGLD